MSKPQVEKKYDTIIVDPDLDSRMRLKQATTAVYNFGKVIQLTTLDETLSRLANESYDVIFLSYRFDQTEISKFIKQAKEAKGGQDTAYVLVLKSKDQDTSTIASNVMIGADGFLFEPYSVDYLLEITRLSSKVKAERSSTREKAAINMVIHDVINAIDQVSYIKACQYDIGSSMRKLRELCSVFSTLEADKISIYFENALKSFEEAPMPKNIFQAKKYGGVSSRIKKKMEERIISELQTKEAEDKAAEKKET